MRFSEIKELNPTESGKGGAKIYEQHLFLLPVISAIMHYFSS